MSKPQFAYVTYIRTTPERLWQALTDPNEMKSYWFGAHAESDWKVGSSWRLLFDDGRVADAGEILESDPPKRLVMRWRNEWKPELKAAGFTRYTMEIEMAEYYPNYPGKAVKLTITHEAEAEQGAPMIEAVSGGWPKVLSNLKSLLETGEPAFHI